MKFSARITLLKKKSPQLVLLLVVLNLVLLSVLIFPKQFQKKTTKTTQYPEVTYLVGKNMDFKQLSNYFTALANQKGAAYSFEVLKRAEIPPNTDLHLLGHVVGDILYKQKGLEGIKICTDDFRNACSHSIVVGLFTAKGEAALADISKACNEAPGGKGAYTMCYHGLGHGILAFKNYEMEAAIELCKKTGTSERQNQEYVECAGGIVMEMMVGVNDPEAWAQQKENYFRTADPLAPCSLDFIDSKIKQICYTYLTPHLFEAAGGSLGNLNETDFTKAFEFCKVLPKADPNRNICMASFGKEFVVLAQNRDIRKIESMTKEQLSKVFRWCLLANDEEGIKQCVISAQGSLFWGGENDRHVSIDFCNLVSAGSYQDACFQSLINAVSYYINDSNYKKEFCNEIPKKYKC